MGKYSCVYRRSIRQHKETSRFPEGGGARRTAALLLIILAAGAFFVWWTMARADLDMRAELLQQTRLVAQAVDVERVQALSGTEADLGSPGYLRLKEHLAIVRSANPQCRFVYLMGHKADGTVFFFVDSDPADSKDYSPPGQIYGEVSEDLHRVFDARAEAVEGPVADRWGVWVSALVPMNNPQTGTVVAVLGMDIDARAWKQSMARAGIPPFLFTLTLMGLVAVYRLARSRSTPWRHAEAAMTVAVGLTLTLAASWLVHANEQRSQRDAFFHLAYSQAARVAGIFHSLYGTELEALAGFFEGGHRVSRNEFQQLVEFLCRNPAVQAWEWIPAVPEEDRLRFEQEARQTGLPEFGIWQKDEAGNRIPAAVRRTSYPVLYVAPIAGNAVSYTHLTLPTIYSV